MTGVRVTASAGDEAFCHSLSEALTRHLAAPSGRRTAGYVPPRVHLTGRRLPEPFRVYPDQGVVVSTWESASVCRYTGLAVEDYLLITSLVGLSQWRVLRHNALLQPEDLHHPARIRCVYAGQHSVQELALLLDPPSVCGGCAGFYRCLGADTELLALRRAIGDRAHIACASSIRVPS